MTQHPSIPKGSTWVKPDWTQAASLTNRLSQEIDKDKPLYADLANLLIVYNDTASDDVLFAHGDEQDTYFIIRFTWGAKPTAQVTPLNRDDVQAHLAKKTAK